MSEPILANPHFRQKSIQLVTTDSSNKFKLTEEGRLFLSSIKTPIAVISIAGMYRTGKSYLVNRLIKAKQDGFITGGSTQAVTKGLSVWGRPIFACDQNGQEMCYIVIDSEGIGSCDQEFKYDMKLLTMVFLISSTVIYNSMGAIDEQSLDQLRAVVQLKNCVKGQSQNQKTKFVWVLRDFALQLVDRFGVEMTADQYLTQCLEDCPGGTLQTKRKNEIRRALRDHLGSKKCFTLVRPTIKQQQLADLSKCKLRTQFLQEIEMIRQSVFRGSEGDVKRIQGKSMNGKLLSNLLESCLDSLNGNSLPQMVQIWQSVKSVADSQFFDKVVQQMKQKLSKLLIPMPKEQLKIKLNQIQNYYYCKMEEEYTSGNVFKKYHREFLKVLQKFNREVKRNNQKGNKQKIMRQVKDFVKDNISIYDVEPTNLSLVKTMVDRMELKVKGQPQGYQYVLSILFDMMYVSQQKSQSIQEELNQYGKMVEVGAIERKNAQMGSMAIKRDYHDALKTINNLKMTQQQNQKDIVLTKHQLEAEKMRFQNDRQEWQIRQAGMIRQIEEIGFKSKQKGEDIYLVVKKLREENTNMLCELSQMREDKVREGLNERKELIFEQKMKQAWGRFDQERKKMQIQISILNKEVKELTDKYDEEKKARQRQSFEFMKQKEIFLSKERGFTQQILQIKLLGEQNKRTYAATPILKDSQNKILRNVENMSNSKIMGSCKKGRDQKYWESQLERVRGENREETSDLRSDIERLKQVCQELRGKTFKQDLQIQSYRQQKQKLQKELALTSERFSDTVSEIQNAKERQRSMYEQSIVKLLNNLNKRDTYSSYKN